MNPDTVNILGREYSITYVKNPSEVDIHNRRSIWGQIDYWTRSIRIYTDGRNSHDIWETLLHEIIHGISTDLSLDLDEDTICSLSVVLADTLIRNEFIKLED